MPSLRFRSVLSTLSRSLSRRPLPAAAPTAQHRRRRPARAHARKPARNPGAARASSPDHTARIRKRRNTKSQAGPTPSMRNTTTTAETAQHSAANTAKKRARSRTHPIAAPQHRSRGKNPLLPTKPDAVLNEHHTPKPGAGRKTQLRCKTFSGTAPKAVVLRLGHDQTGQEKPANSPALRHSQSRRGRGDVILATDAVNPDRPTFHLGHEAQPRSSGDWSAPYSSMRART